ncbi:MAG: RnfABCDGE type electron transport complex subunit D [Planctomycetota bacterium]|jgi:Na+-transporting NADH:ubiquinone oxidoreductase subunit B
MTGAGDTFGTFSTGARPGGTAPFLRSTWSLRRRYIVIAAALVPALGAAIYYHRAHWERTVAVLVVSLVAAAAVELAFSYVRRKRFGLSEATLVTGLLFALILPAGVPLWMVALGAAFGILFGQEAFGGAGHNFFLPALVGKSFLLLSWPQPFAEALKSTAEAVGEQGMSFGNLMFGAVAGGVGEVLPAAIVAGAVLLLVMKIANWRTVVAVLVPAVAVAWGLHALNAHLIDTESELELLDRDKILTPLQTLLSGPLLFAACFLATDSVTSPETNAAKWVHGVIVGVLAVLMKSLSNYATYTEAATFAVLMGNLFAPMIDSVVVAVRFRKAKA